MRRKRRCGSLGASFIIGKDNVSRILDFCRQAKDAGVSSVKLSACVVGNSAKENNAYHAAIADTAREQIDRGRVLGGPGFSIVDHYHRMDERFDKSYSRCPSTQLLIVIGADCAVYSCQDKAYTDSGCLGSIKERSFEEFWFSRENRERLAAIDPRRDCRHHCVSHAKNLLLTDYLALDPAHAEFV